MQDKLSKLKRVAKILDKVEQGSEGITELILDLEDGLESKINEIKDIAETTKKMQGDKGDSPTKDELLELITPLIPEPIKGDNYVLTKEDKKAIAESIKVPIVQKVIEKTEVIREKPLVTEITKEIKIENEDTGEQIISKINEDETSLIKIEKIDGLAKDIKELKERQPITNIINEGGGSSGVQILEDGLNIKQSAVKINFGSGIDVTPTPNGVLVSLDGSEPTNFNLQQVTDNGATTTNNVTVNSLTETAPTLLKLDQTTPQTTVGTFTFPTEVVQKTVTAGELDLYSPNPPSTATVTDVFTSAIGSYPRTVGQEFKYRIYTYQDKYNQRVYSPTYKEVTFTTTVGPLLETTVGWAINDSVAGIYGPIFYANLGIIAYKTIGGVKHYTTTPGYLYLGSYSYSPSGVSIDITWDTVSGADGYLIADYSIGNSYKDLGNILAYTDTGDRTGWTNIDVSTNVIGPMHNVQINWGAVTNAYGYIITGQVDGLPGDVNKYYQIVSTNSKLDNNTWLNNPTLTPSSIYNGQHYFYGELRTNQLNYIGKPALVADGITYIQWSTNKNGLAMGEATKAWNTSMALGDSVWHSVTEDSQVTDSVSIGMESSYSVITSTSSVNIGSYAARNKTNSQYEVNIGVGAGRNGGTGGSNVNIGYYAGNYAQGSGNVFIGNNSGPQSVTSSGSQNVGVGQLAGSAITSGVYNTMFGYRSGSTLTSGSYNTYFGVYAGQNAVAQQFGTYFGAYAGYTLPGGDTYAGTYNNGDIPFTSGFGHYAICHRMNGIAIGAPASSEHKTNVGIGLPYPMAKLQVGGDTQIADITSVGAEKITGTNASYVTDFTNAAWTKTGWTVTTTTATHNAGNTSPLTQASASMVTPLVAGETYLLEFTISSYTTGSLQVSCGNVTITQSTGAWLRAKGRYTIVFTATSTNSLFLTPSNAAVLSIQKVTLKKVTGGNLSVLGTFGVQGNVGFYGVTPVAKASAYTQTYSTASKTMPTATSANLSTTASTQTTPWGFASQAQADNIATQVNKMQTDYINLQKVVNALIDDLQAYGLTS